VDGCGKDKTYNFYRWAGVTTAAGGKGAHEREAPPVRVRSNLP
jgi:hypothetical protein